MEEQGLAAQVGQGQDAAMQAISQIIELLMQGVTPEELLRQGVPQELVMKAIEMVKAQQAQQQQMAPAPQDPGLAQRMVQ